MEAMTDTVCASMYMPAPRPSIPNVLDVKVELTTVVVLQVSCAPAPRRLLVGWPLPLNSTSDKTMVSATMDAPPPTGCDEGVF